MIYTDPSGHFKDGDEKYNEDVLLQLSMYTEQWEFADTAYNLGLINYGDKKTIQGNAEYFSDNVRWAADHPIKQALGEVALFIMDAEIGDPDIAYADSDIENPLSKIYNNDNYEKIRTANNPYGSKGTPEHQKTVQELEDLAKERYPNRAEYNIHNQTSIKSMVDVNRIPDVWVEDRATGKVVEVFEAVRANSKGMVPREVKKGVEYTAKGIKWTVKYVIKALK
ncbi:hypothetical protein [Paenibacillus sp. Soil787]|uniref:hypothetical protein n=1 Tax=Paenibacillus sp. Soil787 TaxID=1736411 RepID=UPI000702FBAF|nr:hypothetical protein [Paenibacillus sp. Soil787]KRF27644.1 hypothetical protein ASG93_29310 [Paenibacillus sp. Soil787]